MKNTKIKKILKYFLLSILIFAIISIIFVYRFFKKSLPQLNGEIKISSLKEEVIVTRDNNGIPTITAKNTLDLFKAQGFIQAQDRLFQMEMAKRQASGTLSEVIGEKAIENDKKFLSYSLLVAAKNSYNSYSKESKEILQAFADGVNEFIKISEENNTLPYEFKIIGFKPGKWTPFDSLVIGKYMAYDLGGHWSYQAMNNWILNNLGEDKLNELLPKSFNNDFSNKEIINSNKLAIMDINEKVANLKLPHIDNGSNNWALSGKKTKSGKPLLADDPHLGLATPSVWYQMNLISPEFKVQGVIFAGVPGIILGNNENIAWGVTNVGPDVQDLYIEKQNPKNPYQFEYDGKWYDAKVIPHTIKVKGKEDIKFDVVYTKHGPIIDELIKSVNDKNIKFSMQWTAHESTKELEAIMMINKSKNWQEFENALKSFEAPAQNFVYADKTGFIAFKANGNIPIRLKGTGALPVPGYSSEYGWKGYIPYDKLPMIINPESGFVSSANTNIVKDYQYHLSNIWAQPYRKNRIDQVLSSKNDFTEEDMKKLQMDIKNLYAEEFLQNILKNTDNLDSEIIKILNEWDKNDDKNSPAPLIFHTLMEKIRINLFKKQMDKNVYKFMKFQSYLVDRILRNEFNNESSIFIKEYGGLKKLLNNSFNDAISELKSKFGNNPKNWRWGKNHTLFFEHPIGKSNKILGKILNSKKIETSGSSITVQAARQNEQGYVNHGASWRFVFDFKDMKGYHIVGPGQSGHFMSSYYNDQVQNWADGKYIENSFKNLIKKNTLKLIP